MWEKKDNTDFKVFLDGSKREDGIGAAAVMYTKERVTPIGQLKVFLGSLTKHNTYEAETIGTILATHLLSNCPETDREEGISVHRQPISDCLHIQSKGHLWAAPHPTPGTTCKQPSMLPNNSLDIE